MKELELIAYCLSLMSEEDYSLMLAFMAGNSEQVRRGTAWKSR